MKTTVEIADGLHAEAKSLAAEQSTTLRDLIEDGLRHVIVLRKSAKPFRLRDGSFKGNGKGLIRPMTWEEMMDECYKGRET